MTITFDAVYADGVLRPVGPVVGLPERARVTVTVDDPAAAAAPTHPFAGWVGDMPDEDAAEMMRAIEIEFGQVNPDDWR